MLFMYIHTHAPDKCIVDQPKELLQLFSAVRVGFQNTGVKVVDAYSVPHEHTFYWLLDTDDIEHLEVALRPMTKMGTARLIPIVKQPYMLS